MRNIYLFVVLLLSMIRCNEADLMQYSDIPRVYLGGYTRAASQTFFYDAEDVVRDTIYVYVETGAERLRWFGILSTNDSI